MTIGSSLRRRGEPLRCEPLQVENEGQCSVNALHLLQREEAGGLGESVQVDGGDLVAHDQGAASADLYGGPEAGLAGAGAREGYDLGA